MKAIVVLTTNIMGIFVGTYFDCPNEMILLTTSLTVGIIAGMAISNWRKSD